MTRIFFDLKNLIVGWISFNLLGLTDLKRIEDRLFPHFNVSITIDDESKILFSDHRNRYDTFSLFMVNFDWRVIFRLKK